MKTILILTDSLNRRYLNCYGAKDPAITPNIDRLAEMSTVFDNHYCGSAPCIPARRDLMTGRLNFLERPWGGIEAFDHTLPTVLKEHGVYGTIFADHFHYMESGGENYFMNFDTWHYIRGQEHDRMGSRPKVPGREAANKDLPKKFKIPDNYREIRKTLQKTEDYPTPKTMLEAASWLEENKDADNFFMWVEGVSPHEPFDVPEEYLKLYGDTYEGEEIFWPMYSTTEDYTEAEIRHLINRYKATITMVDEYVGKLLEVLDNNNMWEDTEVIFTTDHGYMLGEHGFFAKNYMPDYNEVFQLPLMIHLPGQKESRRVSGLSQNIDVFATILDSFNIPLSHLHNPIHGRSLQDMAAGKTKEGRNPIIFGQFGKTVDVTDGKYTYVRTSAREDNQPLYIYTSMPVSRLQYFAYDSMAEQDFDRITMEHMSWHHFPVYKFPTDCFDYKTGSQDFKTRNVYAPEHVLYSNLEDPEQLHPIKDEALEAAYADLLRAAMAAHNAPKEQYLRLGL